MPEFNELPDKVKSLPEESKQIFINIINKDISEHKRQEIRNDIIQGRKEYKAGKTHSGDLKALMKEINE